MVQSKATTVSAYLAALPEDRRTSIAAVRDIIRKNLDAGFEEGMQYGMIGYYVPHRIYPHGYHCDPTQPLPFAALASQKNYMSLYLMCVYADQGQLKLFQDAWAKSGKTLNMGKSCIRFKKLDDLPLNVIGDTIRRVSAKDYIEHCERGIEMSRERKQEKTPRTRNPTAATSSNKRSAASTRTGRKTTKR